MHKIGSIFISDISNRRKGYLITFSCSRSEFIEQHRKSFDAIKSVAKEVSFFIEDLSIELNKLPNDEQRKNYLDKFKKNIFMVDDFWYKDLSEEEKIKFHNVYIKY